MYLVALPLSVLTLGLFAAVVNGCLLAITARLSEKLDIDGLGSAAVLGALAISVEITVFGLVLRPHPAARTCGAVGVVRLLIRPG